MSFFSLFLKALVIEFIIIVVCFFLFYGNVLYDRNSNSTLTTFTFINIGIIYLVTTIFKKNFKNKTFEVILAFLFAMILAVIPILLGL